MDLFGLKYLDICQVITAGVPGIVVVVVKLYFSKLLGMKRKDFLKLEMSSQESISTYFSLCM